MSPRTLPEPVCLTEGLGPPGARARAGARGTNKHPCIIVDRHDHVWVAWQRFLGGRDRVAVTCLRENYVVYESEFSSDGAAHRPVLCEEAPGRVCVAWSEVTPERAEVFFARIGHGRTEAASVTASGLDLAPAMAAGDGSVWLAYQSFRHGRASVFARRLVAGKWSDEIEVTPGLEAYRPALVAVPGGRVRVYFDAYAGGRYDVYSAEWDGVSVTAPQRLSTGGTWCHSPAAAPDGLGGAVVAWQGIGTDRYVCYDVAVDGRTERVGSCACAHTSHALCANAEAVWLTWRVQQSVFRMRRLDRASGVWSAPLTMPRTGQCCRRPSMTVDRRGTVWLAWQSPPLSRSGSRRPPAEVSGHVWTPPERLESVDEANRRSDIFLQAIHPEQMAALANPAAAPHEWASEAGHEIAVRARETHSPEHGERRVYFGDLHGHACISDGLGTHDQFYRNARDVSGLDFAAVAEHAEFPEELTPSEWSLIRLTARQFDEPGRFVTLPAYEWTSNEIGRPYGHKNVYYPDERGGLFSAMRPGGETPEALFYNVGRYGGLVMPHHVSVSWGPTDWSHHDPNVQRVCEIASIHGVMEYDGNPRGHADPPVPGCSVQAALARGYRLGFVAGGDTHRMAPGRDGGVAAVVCGALTREDVFAALRARRCYASTGPRIEIEFDVNGCGMGGEVATGPGVGRAVVGYTVRADRPIAAVEIVRNNETVHREAPGKAAASGRWEDPAGAVAGSYYYLRVELEGGEYAWASPVWIGHAAVC